MDFSDITIEVHKTRKKGSQVVGHASIQWGDLESDNGFKIYGFKILVGKYPDSLYCDKNGNPLWVASPAFPDPTTGGFHNIIHASPELWRKLQGEIIAVYLEKLGDI